MAPTMKSIDIKAIVREYISKEILREVARADNPLPVRVLGELLGDRYSDEIIRHALDVARELVSKP